MFNLADLIKSKTREEFFDEMISLAATLGLSVTSWHSGAVVRTVINLSADIASTFSSFIVEPIKGGFGDLLSSDTWATAWAKGTYDVDRIEASAATGVITAVNASATQYDLDPGNLIVAHSVTGKTYRNQATISILASSTLTGIAVSADEVGIVGNAAPGYVIVVVAPSMTGVTVTNPAAVLGADQETVEALVRRARAKFGSLSPLGPKSAYDYVATTPYLPDGTALSNTSTPITRSGTRADPLTGLITVTIATAAGAPTVPDIAIVQAAEDRWAEPWCVSATAVAAGEAVISPTYQAWIKNSNLTEAELKSNIAVALAAYLASVPIGGELIPPDFGAVYVEQIQHVINDANIGTVRVLLTVPSVDVALTESQVPVLGTITGTITKL